MPCLRARLHREREPGASRCFGSRVFNRIKSEANEMSDWRAVTGTPLNRGLLEGGVLTCPTHLWQFDVVNGGVGVRECQEINA